MGLVATLRTKQELSLNLLITWQFWIWSMSRLGEGKEEFSTEPCTHGTAPRETGRSSRPGAFPK